MHTDLIEAATLTEKELLLEVWALPESLGFGQKPPKEMTDKQRYDWSLALAGRDAAVAYIQHEYGDEAFRSPLEGIDKELIRLILDAARDKALWAAADWFNGNAPDPEAYEFNFRFTELLQAAGIERPNGSEYHAN